MARAGTARHARSKVAGVNFAGGEPPDAVRHLSIAHQKQCLANLAQQASFIPSDA